MYEWVIIGGGIQGVTLAVFMLKTGKTKVDKLAIIDRNNEPLANWKRNTKVISMPYLRSPSVHHLDVDPFSLQSFVKKGSYHQSTAFYGQYKRPSLEMFNDHCDHLVNDLMIRETWVQGEVLEAFKTSEGWQVQLKNGREIKGKKLVLAIGISEQLNMPDWAMDLDKQSPGSVYHIFDETIPEFERMKLPITIVGGGITSIHLALKLSELYPNQVTLLKRHSFRIHDFDSDPGWLGPKLQNAFRNEKNYVKRREEILSARHRGSIPRDLYIKLLNRIKNESLVVEEGEIVQGHIKNACIHLFDKDGKFIKKTGTVLLATGYLPCLPGSEWILPIVETLDLPCAECGYPIVTKTLQWGQDLYVTGALAELEMGPIARNISGARQAAERIVKHL
ncbi:FAD-dependent oxidoreductase [Neobacillus niacini]|uniref:FAD-dependent oxidoreductase n=1 Tax=Neobacillus niacini TaxID=86668 RepID=UPI0028573026|nr:FAD/NAD(P)-binding protein [Neobacillus niacini]MDR6997736.1 cation diffusion facilitator CzcD-associated flavoprotein CzcO [Neobacillus niacini]